jgi:hypothetical protein
MLDIQSDAEPKGLYGFGLQPVVEPFAQGLCFERPQNEIVEFDIIL